MITYIKGNIFDSNAQVLVNPINLEGVMGKGLALRFKEKYPEMFYKYKLLCDNKQLELGKLHLYKGENKWILNFPTKISWKNPSKLEYIEVGLIKFTNTYKEKNIESIAFPKLGCGEGGLDFESQVRPLMEKYLSKLNIDVYIYI